MKIKISRLRQIIIESLSKSAPYDVDLVDDESFEKDSVYVPEDIKVVIRRWIRSMGLQKR